MDKCIRILEFLEYLFGDPKTARQEIEIIAGTLEAYLPCKISCQKKLMASWLMYRR